MVSSRVYWMKPGVWNRALTQSELLTNINLQITNGTGLWWHARGMNESTSTVVNDSIVPTVPGTITGVNYARVRELLSTWMLPPEHPPWYHRQTWQQASHPHPRSRSM